MKQGDLQMSGGPTEVSESLCGVRNELELTPHHRWVLQHKIPRHALCRAICLMTPGSPCRLDCELKDRSFRC